MEKRRIVCAVAALMLAASLSLCSCGDNTSDDSTAPETNASAAAADNNEAPAEQRASADKIADDLLNGITYVDQLSEISPEMVEKLYGIAPDKYTAGKVYVGGVSTAEEIACFDAVDEAAAAEIKTALENRISAQIKSVEGYNPDELPKLNDPVLVTYGSSVYMCLSNDNDKAKEIIG